MFRFRKHIIPFLIPIYKEIERYFNIRHHAFVSILSYNICYLMRADSPRAHHPPPVEDVLPFFSNVNVDLSCVEREKVY